MNKRKNILFAVLVIMAIAVAGYVIANQNRKETVNGYYVEDFVGETTEDTTIPEDVVEDVPEDIELQENELYLGTEENTETDPVQEDLLDSLHKAGKTSLVEIEKEEKELGLKGKISYYYYNKCDGDQKAVYRSILKGLKNREDRFYVNVTREELYHAYCRVMYDHPELFWAELNYRYWDYGTYVVLEPVYNRTKDQIKTDKEKVNKALKKILKEAKKEKNNYDKTLYVYKYLIRTLDYKLDVKDNQNLYSALVNKVTVCAGYAKASQLLLQKLGIQSLYVCGNTTRGRHAWNILKLGKQYYQMDSCWGDLNYQNYSYDYIRNLPKILQYDYGYFCIDDKQMFKTRTQENELKPPACKDTGKSFYVYNKRYFTKYGDAVKNSIKSSIRKGKNYWQGQMANKEAYDALLKAVKNGLYSQYLYDIKGKTNGTYYMYLEDSYVIKLYY